MTFMIAHASTGQAVHFIDNFQISTRQLIKLCCGISIVFTACAIVISANVIFPLPFLELVLTPIYNVIHVTLFRVILGIRMLRQLLVQRGQLIQYMNLLHAQIMMMFVYPAYEVLFRFVQGSRFQLPVILLLPVMKVIIKNIVLRCTKHVEDMTPELVIFTVDFFNAIYVATCMQSATSIHPSSPDLKDETRPTERPQRINYTISEQPTLLQNSLEALFTLECLVITAYLEAVVPFFYSTYILVMVHFPSAQYHSEMSGVSRGNVGSTVLPVFMFGLLQVASFWMLVAVITRNCGMRALYQLAFVLESHMWSIQSKLMVWMMITLCFRLVHFGVDFTFKFSRLGW
ncbi:hypothetical protein PHYPSEUDO_001901 [Phytophthora pseudosyringae]|uniref:Transmembrane protein n=1 Tax=Phytophthora pseudosyringae TaxID=221518 RepID=A0A8T1WI27_9STRA|nr:hypothetical protein PHYPSEUDO_001901 [Phytophthora pseudosyringae]